ncbi:hypothetical protein Droror1_Dr00002348 [Drosera rotundifolia]
MGLRFGSSEVVGFGARGCGVWGLLVVCSEVVYEVVVMVFWLWRDIGLVVEFGLWLWTAMLIVAHDSSTALLRKIEGKQERKREGLRKQELDFHWKSPDANGSVERFELEGFALGGCGINHCEFGDVGVACPRAVRLRPVLAKLAGYWCLGQPNDLNLVVVLSTIVYCLVGSKEAGQLVTGSRTLVARGLEALRVAIWSITDGCWSSDVLLARNGLELGKTYADAGFAFRRHYCVVWVGWVFELIGVGVKLDLTAAGSNLAVARSLAFYLDKAVPSVRWSYCQVKLRLAWCSTPVEVLPSRRRAHHWWLSVLN